MHFGQIGIGVVIAGMLYIPVGLAALLHDVVPGINALFVILGEEIERRAGKIEHLGMLFA